MSRDCPSCGSSGTAPTVIMPDLYWCEDVQHIVDDAPVWDHGGGIRICPGPHHRLVIERTAPTITDAEKDAAHKAWEDHRWESMKQYGGAPPPIPNGALDVILEAAARARQENHDE